MKRSLVIAMIIFMSVIPLLAQEEKYTEEEALLLIEAYGAREAEANEKIAIEEAKINSLKAKISEAENAIADIKAKLKEIEQRPKYDVYTVKPGDWLSKLAEYPEVYGWGNYARWKDIYNVNKDLIKDPDLIYPDWKLKVPRP